MIKKSCSSRTIHDVHTCPVCGGCERSVLYETRDRHYGIKGEWDVTECGQCGLVQLAPMLSADQLINLYPISFYAYDKTKHQNRLKRFIKGFFFPSLIVKDPIFIKPGKILDYGCGTGWSLLKFRDKGWSCVDIEPSTSAAEIGREHLGLDVRTGTIHTVKLPASLFNYIRANHSLEHDPDVLQTIREFRNLLTPDGLLLIGVPNIDSLPAKLFGKYWWYLGAPVHTYNFSYAHLSDLLSKNQFEVTSVRYCGNYAGILGSIQIYLNRNNRKLLSNHGFVFNFPPFMLIAQFLASVLNYFRLGDAIEVIARPRPPKNESSDLYG